MIKIISILLSILGITIAGWLVISRTGTESIPIESELSKKGQEAKFDKAPDFSLKNYTGGTVSLSDFRGKPTILNSWAVWCPFCVKELEEFAKLQREFGDNIAIIAIDRSESLKKQKRFTDDLGITDELIFLLDPKDSFYRSIGGFSMPETLFVDKEGNILLHKRGPMRLDEMKQKVKELFNINV